MFDSKRISILKLLFRYAFLWSGIFYSNSITAQQEHILKQADSLLQLGEWQAAQLEYERYAFLTPAALHKVELPLAHIAFHQKQYLEAAERFQKLASPLTMSDSLYWHVATCYFLANEHPLCQFYCKEALYSRPVSIEKRKNWAVLYALSLNSMFQFKESLHFIQEEVSFDANEKAELAVLYKEVLNFRPKSETRAVLYSMLLPGAGQMYAGKWDDGLISLGICGGLGTATIWAFLQQRWFLGIFSGITIFQQFYEGGGRYSKRLVTEQNTLKNNILQQKIQKKLSLFIK